jgi:enediyne polyketide synthase
MLGRNPVLIPLAADSLDALRGRIEDIRRQIAGASDANLADLVPSSAGESQASDAPLRAAVLAYESGDCERRLTMLERWLEEGNPGLRWARGVFLGVGGRRPRIGFLLPGQGAPLSRSAGALGCICPEAAELYAKVELLDGGEDIPAERSQLAIVLSSVAALHAVRALGIRADFAVGHSLGELTALHWAGALDQHSLVNIARSRGEAMTVHTSPDGAMAEVQADERTLSRLLTGSQLTIACMNSPHRHVVSGPSRAVEGFMERAERRGVRAIRLKVTGAFHSPMMRDAVPVFERVLATNRFTHLQGRVLSTVTGAPLGAEADLPGLLSRQLEDPVRFAEAGLLAAQEADLLIEVGPGRMLAGMMSEIASIPVMSTCAEKSTLDNLVEVAGMTYAAGAPVNLERLLSQVDRRYTTS